MANEQKNIRIYLATANDLQLEHKEIVILVEELNKIFNRRHVHLELVPHNQEKSEINTCELSLALYYTKFGDFSKNDFKLAYNSLGKGENPKKIYVFFKESENITQDLKDFKDNFVTEFGHFFCKFENVDTLKLHFLMQVESYQNNYGTESLIDFKGHKVYFDTYEVVDLDNIPFAALNADYARMRNDLVSYSKEIEELRLKILKYPKDEDFQDDLQENLNARNKLKEEFKLYQETLFNTALRIAKISHIQMSERLQRGINAFANGNASEANAILSEAEIDVDNFLHNYREHKALLEEEIDKIELSIEELQLKAKVVLADTNFTIEQRIVHAKNAYAKAREVALEIALNKEKMNILFFEYACFLTKFAFYNEAAEIYNEQIQLVKELFESDTFWVSSCFNNLGTVYYNQGNWKSALEYFVKSLENSEDLLGYNHPVQIRLLQNIMNTNIAIGQFQIALNIASKVMQIQEESLGLSHSSLGTTYNTLGSIFKRLNKAMLALQFYIKATENTLTNFGEIDSRTATCYDNMGLLAAEMGLGEFAKSSHLKAIEIYKQVFGEKHPDTAKAFNNLGMFYRSISDYKNALNYFTHAYAIYPKNNEVTNELPPVILDNIGSIYFLQKNYNESLKYRKEAVLLFEKKLDENHPSLAIANMNLGATYNALHEYTRGSEYLSKAYIVFMVTHGNEHPTTKLCRNHLIASIGGI